MKQSFTTLTALFLAFVTFSQSDTTDFLIRNRGTREVIEITGNKAVAMKLISFDTKYGRQWKMERLQEVDTLFYNNRGVFYGTNGELRIKNEGFTFSYVPDGERNKLKVHMKRDGYQNPNLLINSSYSDCRVDSLKEVLMGISPYFNGYYYAYDYYRSPFENQLVNEFLDSKSFRVTFESTFQHVADSLVKVHVWKTALTDSILKEFDVITPVELDTVFQQLMEDNGGWSYSYCKEIVNGFAVENPARFCQWVEQTTTDKHWIYNYTDKRARKSLKAFDTDSPVKKEILRNHRGNVVMGTLATTLALSFYGGIGVGIANLIAVNR